MPLIVGESLVPAIIPMLRMLGVEEQVKSFSRYKPGAAININEKVNFSFPFDKLRTNLPQYAYNVPRDRFDATLLEAARQAGARVFELTAGLERVEGADRVRLSAETMAATDGFFSGAAGFDCGFHRPGAGAAETAGFARPARRAVGHGVVCARG